MPEPTIREQVEVALRKANVLRESVVLGDRCSPLPYHEVSDLMAALSPLLERVERDKADCAPYLKDDEAPAECIERNRKDIDALMTVLAQRTRERDDARTFVERWAASVGVTPEHRAVVRLLDDSQAERDQLKAGFESELRRRVEGLSCETWDDLWSELNHPDGKPPAEVLLTALLAPPATPETERE